MPVDYSCPIQTTPFVSGWKGTSAEFNMPLAQMQVHIRFRVFFKIDIHFIKKIVVAFILKLSDI
jgi:hypothetical protein